MTVRTSERLSVPATSHWSFANVTVKTVAKKSASTTGPGRERGHSERSELRQLLGARAAREAVARLLRDVGRRQASVGEALVQLGERPLHRLDVVGRRDHAGSRLADQGGGGAVRRHGSEDRPLGREVLEHLPGEHALAAAACVGDQEQERLGVALELERRLARRVRDQLELVAEPTLLRPLPVGGAEVAEEARLDVEPGLGERGQERARVALAEEAARVRDPEAVARCVVEPGEVVEVAAVRDRHDRSPRREAPRLLGDRIRDAGDRVGRVGDEPRDAVVDLLLRAHGHALGAPVRVRDERVAQVGDPLRAGRLLDRGADEVDRVRRRGRQRRRRSFSFRAIRIAAGIAVRFQLTFSSGTSSRREASRAWTSARSSPSVPCSSSAGLRPFGPR